MNRNDTGEQIYQFIVNYKLEHDGCSPSYRQMQKAVGLSTVSQIHYHVHQLAKAGRIRLLPSYQIAVVGGVWIAPKLLSK
jgi:SOS-response transcriptional repressor LexA